MEALSVPDFTAEVPQGPQHQLFDRALRAPCQTCDLSSCASLNAGHSDDLSLVGSQSPQCRLKAIESLFPLVHFPCAGIAVGNVPLVACHNGDRVGSSYLEDHVACDAV